MIVNILPWIGINANTQPMATPMEVQEDDFVPVKSTRRRRTLVQYPVDSTTGSKHNTSTSLRINSQTPNHHSHCHDDEHHANESQSSNESSCESDDEHHASTKRLNSAARSSMSKGAQTPQVHAVFIVCPLEDCEHLAPLTTNVQVSMHLQSAHRIEIAREAEVLYVLEEYLKEKARLLPPNEPGRSRVLGDPNDEHDARLRKRLQQAKLQEMLNIQQREREHDAYQPRQCIFCKTTQNNRAELFNHMYNDHGLSIGLPDNLVNVDEFLSLLSDKMTNRICIYCEKVFTSPTILRKHMRKKKHVKINPNNHEYDRFYLINYLEPGRRWEEIAAEQDKMSDSGDWEDWTESEQEDTTMCLICEKVCPSPDQIWKHMLQRHQFDFDQVRHECKMDFYDCIKFINFARRQQSLLKCLDPTCSSSEFDSMDELVQHYETSPTHFHPDNCKSFWHDTQFLIPTYENDPLLSGIQDDQESVQSDEDQSEQIREMQLKFTRNLMMDDDDALR